MTPSTPSRPSSNLLLPFLPHRLHIYVIDVTPGTPLLLSPTPPLCLTSRGVSDPSIHSLRPILRPTSSGESVTGLELSTDDRQTTLNNNNNENQIYMQK